MITDAYYGYCTTTTCRVFVRSDEDGTPTVTVNGATFTGDAIDTDTDDGTGVVDVTGLEPGREYTASITVGSGSKTQIIRTLPASGRYSFIVASCLKPGRRDFPLRGCYNWLSQQGIKPLWLWALGDTPYNDIAGTHYGITTTSTDASEANAISQSNAYAHHLKTIRKTDWRYVLRDCGLIKRKDDHEYLDNYCTDAVEMKTRADLTWLAAMSDVEAAAAVEAVVAAQDQAYTAYAKANPATSEGIDYFAFEAGPIKFVCPDTLKYKGASSGTTFLGATQKTWLLSELDHSKPLTVMMTPKTFADGNGDGWWDYTTGGDTGDIYDLAAELAALEINLYAYTGDKHIPFVQFDEDFMGEGREVLAVNGCPIGVEYQNLPVNFSGDIVWSAPSDPQESVVAYGIVDIDAKTLEMGIYGQKSKRMWRKMVTEAGSSYPVSKTS